MEKDMKDEIVLNNLGLIYKVIKDLHCNYTNQEEFEQYYYAGLVGLIKASKTYDPLRGKSTYLVNGIRKNILSTFTIRSAKKRYTGMYDISLNKEINDIELQDLIVNEYDFVDEMIIKEWVNGAIKNMRNKKDAEVIKLRYLKGMGTKAIAEQYGVSREAIEQRLKHGLQALKRMLERDL